MEPQNYSVHPAHMVKFRKTTRPPYRRTFLRQWREKAEMSLEKASAEMGVTHGQLSRIERGYSPYSQKIIETAARLYGCKDTDILGRSPADTEDQLSRIIAAIKGVG